MSIRFHAHARKNAVQHLLFLVSPFSVLGLGFFHEKVLFGTQLGYFFKLRFAAFAFSVSPFVFSGFCVFPGRVIFW